jgi:hypothetical protein
MIQVYTEFFVFGLMMLLPTVFLNHCKTVAYSAPDNTVLQKGSDRDVVNGNPDSGTGVVVTKAGKLMKSKCCEVKK